MGKILSVGLDTSFLFTREMVLRQTGAEVWSAKVEPALILAQSQFFDVVLLCHTLPDQDILHISKLFDLFWPVSRVLLLGERANSSSAGLEAPSQMGPLPLVEKTVKLLAHTRDRGFSSAALIPFSNGPHPAAANLARKF